MWYAKRYVPLQAGSIDGTDTVPHDRAVQRAQLARYVPPKERNGVSGDPYKTLFVGRLNPETTEDTLSTFFSTYGPLITTTITRNFITGDSRGYGFIEFKNERDCRDAYMHASKSTLDDRQILVDYERSRVMEGWIPRRLGGGFGGRKESGQLRFGARDRPFKRPFKPKDYQNAPSIDPEQRHDDCWRRLNPLGLSPRVDDSHSHSHENRDRNHETSTHRKRERSRETYRSRDDEEHTRDRRRSSFVDERSHRSRNRDDTHHRDRERGRDYSSHREQKRHKRDKSTSPSRHKSSSRRSHRSSRRD
ncbi:hypothetical protein K7432_002071 [Basidiobolus ranarum]|uniref:RRM domain-containing protein n=1 Tax=Basidiobolus ranarum TaxID=34480 RepID=A0ABR2W9A2_9FUNG